MKKFFMFLIVFLIILVALLFVGKNLIAKTAVTSSVKVITGLQMDIDSMDVGISNTLVGINGMKLYNPAGYQERVMVDMPEIYVDYDLGSFLKRKAHLEEVRINLKALTVVKDKDGNLNIDSLKVVKEGKDDKKPEEKKKTEVKIDVLDLKIGKVAYKDYSISKEPKTLEYNLNIHEKFYNITDLNEMGKLILVKALMDTNIAKLANFQLDSLKSEVSDTLKKVTDTGIRETGKIADKAVGGTVKDIQKKLKLPFGKQE